jgi:SAM-dependent methyltransferase
MGLSVNDGWLFDHDLPKEDFDVVTCTAVIEYFTDPLEALRQMNGLLKPGGFLFINTQDFRGMVLRNGLESWFKFVHTYYFTHITLTSLIGQAGFRVIRSWVMEPILKYSNIVYPGNFCSGELNIIAQKDHSSHEKMPLRDDIGSLKDAFNNARKRDYPYQIAKNLANRRYLGAPLRKVGGKIIKKKDVFRDYFDPDGNVLLPPKT